ncbi:hypothetical protein ACRQ5Q_36080 [Bradyrhizobium sp. PMVTL-01]
MALGDRRCERKGRRPKLEPPQVTKLGHLVLETPDFNRSVRW